MAPANSSSFFRFYDYDPRIPEFSYDEETQSLHIYSDGFYYPKHGDNKPAKNVYFHGGVRSIDRGALEDCVTVENVYMDDTVDNLSYGAFLQCTSLKNITFSKSLKKLDLAAFDRCSGLRLLYIPDTITEIAPPVMNECGEFREFIVSKDNKEFTSADGVLYSKDMKVLVRFPSAINGTFTVGEGVEKVGAFAFSVCNIEKVILPDSLRTVGEGAFYRCERLSTVEGGRYLERVDSEAFAECYSLTRCLLPDTVKELGEHVYIDCTFIKEIHLPSAAQYYEAGFTRHCRMLERITVGDDNPYYMVHEGAVYTKDGRYLVSIVNSFKGRLEILPGTLEIEPDACADRDGLEEVIIPEGVTVIGSEAFRNCHALKNVIFPESLAKIDKQAFEHCSSLTEISLPDRTRSFGEEPFGGCAGLRRLRTYASNPALPVFRGLDRCRALEAILAPNIKVSRFNTALSPLAAAGMAEMILDGEVTDANMKSDLDGCIRARRSALYVPVTVNKPLREYILKNGLFDTDDISAALETAIGNGRIDVAAELVRARDGSGGSDDFDI